MARPHSPLITRETVAAAGLQVIDEHGLEGFSLSRVALALGVKPPSLYHHFRDRSEVLAAVARQILLQADEPRRFRTEDWREALVGLALSARRSILRHPHAAPLLLIHPPRYVVLRGYERSLRLMDRMGVPRERQMLIVQGMDAMLLGAALTAAYAHAHALAPFPQYDPGLFPSLAAAAQSHGMDEEATFAAMTRCFLAGLDQVLPPAT